MCFEPLREKAVKVGDEDQALDVYYLAGCEFLPFYQIKYQYCF